MSRAYNSALDKTAANLASGGRCLDCGAGDGSQFLSISRRISVKDLAYVGLEWDAGSVAQARQKGIPVMQADLNYGLPFADKSFQCVVALSVLEHLVFGCRFLKEAYRVLAPGGRLILVTPNLSAWFNVFLLVLGRMPSSGPHPDSAHLLEQITPVRFRELGNAHVEDEMPVDRHIVVFTFRILEYYLKSLGFRTVEGHGFGLYPFPSFMQPLLEYVDPWHCHQMLFDCKR